MSELLTQTNAPTARVFNDVRSLIDLMDGRALRAPVLDEAAALYAKLPGNSADKRRALRLLERWVEYIETGVLDLSIRDDITTIIGPPVEEAQHLREEEDGREVLVVPPVLRLVRGSMD